MSQGSGTIREAYREGAAHMPDTDSPPALLLRSISEPKGRRDTAPLLAWSQSELPRPCTEAAAEVRAIEARLERLAVVSMVVNRRVEELRRQKLQTPEASAVVWQRHSTSPRRLARRPSRDARCKISFGQPADASVQTDRLGERKCEHIDICCAENAPHDAELGDLQSTRSCVYWSVSADQRETDALQARLGRLHVLATIVAGNLAEQTNRQDSGKKITQTRTEDADESTSSTIGTETELKRIFADVLRRRPPTVPGPTTHSPKLAPVPSPMRSAREMLEAAQLRVRTRKLSNESQSVMAVDSRVE